MIKKIINKLLNKLFYNKPYPALRLAYFLGIDIYVFTLPLFHFLNRNSFKKLKRLKREGKSPKIVFFSMEGDGRFERFNELSKADDSLVTFRILIQSLKVEELYFAEYAKKPIGFYEDARFRYIEPSNMKNRLNYRKHFT